MSKLLGGQVDLNIPKWMILCWTWRTEGRSWLKADVSAKTLQRHYLPNHGLAKNEQTTYVVKHKCISWRLFSLSRDRPLTSTRTSTAWLEGERTREDYSTTVAAIANLKHGETLSRLARENRTTTPGTRILLGLSYRTKKSEDKIESALVLAFHDIGRLSAGLYCWILASKYDTNIAHSPIMLSVLTGTFLFQEFSTHGN